MFFLDAFLKGLKPQYDDDSCDRLNYYYTPMLFVIFSLTLSAKQGVSYVCDSCPHYAARKVICKLLNDPPAKVKTIIATPVD
ncbi:hypothetical protein ANCDUO_14675, partial [Ancylostoma duodenale]